MVQICNYCQRPGTIFAKIWNPNGVGYTWACKSCFMQHSTYSTDPVEVEQFWRWHTAGKIIPLAPKETT